VSTPALPPDYPALLGRLDDWQAGVRTSFPGVVPCRAGCVACCRGPFDISVADAREVRDAVAALPAGQRSEVLARAASQLATMTRLEPGFEPPWDLSGWGESRVDALMEALADDPCPALGPEGECRIYPARPAICRMMGLGIRTRSGSVLENGCPIQEEFPSYAGLPPQPFDLEGWELLEEAARAEAARMLFGRGDRAHYETTVAGAAMLGAVFEEG
jgi:Fe-S-cluster containining protein